MGKNDPCVSIGLPVFNGEKYLEEALNSILAQTFTDFEIIISDNASTDRTQKICQTYAAKDRRIRYYRNEKNLGASLNFNRVFELASGKYFKWASYDDVLGPEFLERCVAILDQDASIVLCHTKSGRIDEHSKVQGLYDENQYMRLESPKPHERFFDLIRIDHHCIIVFGVIRTSALKHTSLIGRFPASDRVLLAQLGLLGRFYEIPEILFFRRDHPETTERTWREKPERVTWYDPSKAKQIIFIHWRLYYEYFLSISRIPIRWTDRLLCYIQLARLSTKRWRYNLPWWRWLIIDLERAVRQSISRLRWSF